MYLLMLLAIFNLSQLNAQETTEPEYVETEATITDLDYKVRGRSSTMMAAVTFVDLKGDTIATKARILHIPLIGSLKSVGDQIDIVYQKDNPYLIKSAGDSFLQTYGLYLLIAAGIIISGYRFFKYRKNS
ncbi:hypothetical protein SAMN05421855_10439 [Ulvibacter litoralis]|uniref:LPXTG-motif cell wall anchor domain-containing protein n=2 Tax=Ulvibacter litoralis TaxID=227084 RepID=A0A1G7HEC4_9FLAO|nr:hypothetical protein SAMN05421855_10439 [Ulvibacter litoralis]